MKCKIILGFCILAVLAEQFLGAPVTKSDRVTPKTDDDSPKDPKDPKDEGDQAKRVNDEDDASNYLKRFGYSNPGISKNSRDYKDELKESIKRMQKFHRLNVTGELDNDTLEVMNSPRCSLPDIITGPDGKQKRYVLFTKWRSNSVTYRVDNYPSRTSGFSGKEDIDITLDSALKMWTVYSNLNITKSETANIKMGFYKGYHGDDDPFDGPGGTLAHAFFPYDGRVHFDDSEKWSRTNDGYNLLQVATHEGGHALGLAHTSDPNAVMYPTYRYQSYFKLGDDDIRGIQALYGTNPFVTRPPPTTTTTLKPWTWGWFWSIFWR